MSVRKTFLLTIALLVLMLLPREDAFGVYVVKDEASCLKVEIQGQKGHCVNAPDPEQGKFCPTGEFGVGACKADDNIYCCVKGEEVSTESACKTAGGICRDFTSSDTCLSNEYIRGKCDGNKPCCLPVSGDAFSCQSQIGACVAEGDCKVENRIAQTSDCPGTKNPGKVCCKTSRDELCKKINGTCTTGGSGCPQGTVSKMDCEQKDGRIPACCVASNSNIAPTSSNSVYTLFEQIPGTQGRNMQFPEYIAALYKFLVWGIVFAAILMVMIGGFWYLTAAGNTSQVGTAKTIISDALLGLVVILFTWIILSVINPDLVSINLKSLSALKVNILAPATSPTGGSTTGSGNNGNSENNGTPSPSNPESQKPPTGNEGDAWGDDSAIRSELQSNNISINAKNCAKVGDSACTSVYQLGASAVAGLKSLASGCNCAVTVTGGTEYWLHSEKTQHRPGNSAVDIRHGGVDSYIQQNGTVICSPSGKPLYKVGNAVFWNEDSKHWHANFATTACSGF